MTDAASQCGTVALIGAPNAGKSTLMNALLGHKLAIVTPKAQTTRRRMTGVMVHRQSQIVFIDTPGMFAAPGAFEKAMVKEAWRGAGDADIVALMIDAAAGAKKGLDEETQEIVRRLARKVHPSPLEAETHMRSGEGFLGERSELRTPDGGYKDSVPLPDFVSSRSASPTKSIPLPRGRKGLIVLLNKIDRAPKEALLVLAGTIDAALCPARIFMISALKEDGLLQVKDYLASALPERAFLYPQDHLTDVSERVLAAEITREKLFLKLHEELPYSLTVETEKWEEFRDGSVKIHQIVFVERESHRKIVLGRGGAMLKAVGLAARRDITEQLGRTAHLFLFVKVKRDWKRDTMHRVSTF